MWLIYRYQKRKVGFGSRLVVSLHEDAGDWGWVKRQKTRSLENLKESFTKAGRVQAAIKSADDMVREFIVNHGCSIAEIVDSYDKIELPESISKQELILREELKKYYRNREDRVSKVFSIYLALQRKR